LTRPRLTLQAGSGVDLEKDYNKNRRVNLGVLIMRREFILLMIIAALMLLSPAVLAQSHTSGQHRIIQPIMINGQSAQGAYIIENGVVQGYRCPSPQQYVTADQSQNGWACFDPSSGLWLLHAQPPSSATVPSTQESPNVIYDEPSTVYVPSYSYAYPYYPNYPYSYYGYPYFWGPGLGFAFNFGSHGHGFYGGHGFHDGNAFHGGHGFAPGGGFGHGGGFAHGGFAHGGGFAGHMGGGHR
jgi:uncharacterized membrane protein YgcG